MVRFNRYSRISTPTQPFAQDVLQLFDKFLGPVASQEVHFRNQDFHKSWEVTPRAPVQEIEKFPGIFLHSTAIESSGVNLEHDIQIKIW